MRKFLILLSVLFFLLAFGCAYQSKEAEDLLKEAKAHFTKAEDYVNRWSSEVNSGSASPGDLKATLDKTPAYLSQAENELKIAKANLEKIKSLKLPDWRKQHADLLIKACDAEREVLNASEGATKALNEILKYGINLKQSTEILESVSKKMGTLDNLLGQEKWKEVKEEAAAIKKDLQKARKKVFDSKESDISGINDYLKTVDLMIKLVDAINRFADAAIKENSSSAKKIADEIEGYSNQLDKLGSPDLSFDAFISRSLTPYEEEMEQKEQEAESFLQSAEKLYQENVK